jgi:signal peptidase I
MKRRRTLRLALLGALLVAALLLSLTLRTSVVVGNSMAPTLRPWDYCISVRTRQYNPRRGDIVTFRTADDPPLYIIKRVVALPGETIAIERGIVTINGRPLPEPYTTINPAWEMEPLLVPEGRIFVLGDNRSLDREDSVQGLVATRLVVGRVLWCWRWKK